MKRSLFKEMTRRRAVSKGVECEGEVVSGIREGSNGCDGSEERVAKPASMWNVGG
jgi:hypothetical protein